MNNLVSAAINNLLKPAKAGQTTPAAGNPPQVDDVKSVPPNSGASVQPPPSNLPAGAKPFAKKGGGYYVPPGTANGPIVAGEAEKPPTPPQQFAPVKPAPKPPEPAKPAPQILTVDVLVAEYSKVQVANVRQVLVLGYWTDVWIRDQNERPVNELLDRASAIKLVRRRLAEGSVDKHQARVDLYIRCYQAAKLFSYWSISLRETWADVNRLSLSALRLFPVLIERDKTADTWRVIPAYEKAARALWKQAVEKKMTAAAIDAEITKILPERKPAGSSAAVKLPKLLKVLPELSLHELYTLEAQVKDAISRRTDTITRRAA